MGQMAFDLRPPEPRPPAQAHSDTSTAAAEEIAPKAVRLRGVVLAFIKGAGGATDEEISTGTGLPPNTSRPRRVELVDMGLVRDSGTRRKTASGRSAVVWTINQGDER